MPVLTDYKGLNVVDGATGDGGIALTDNFKTLADRAPYQAAANPGVNDDSGAGFAVGDTWLNTSTSVLWSCVSATNGAAVWKSVLKRTSSVLELIPLETTEAVQVAGQLKVIDKLGVQRTPTSCPLEIQQDSGDTVGGCRVYNASASQAAELAVTSGGSVLLRRSTSSSPVFLINSYFRLQGGNVGIGGGTVVPTAPLDLEGDTVRLRTSKTPASSSATGNQGDICWDSNYVYICVATNTWKRAAMSTW